MSSNPPTPSSGGAPSNRLTPGEVQGKLVTGAQSPLEFLKRNTFDPRQQTTATPVPPPAPEAPLPPRAPTPETPVFAEPSSSVDALVKNLTAEAEKALTPPAAETPAPAAPGADPAAPTAETPKPENPLIAKMKGGREDNMKNLRVKAQEAERLLGERDAELTTTREKLTKYEKGEEIPETLKERMTTLEGYEKLHALKLSREYQETYVQPETELCEKAVDLAKSYGVDPNVLDEAVEIEDKKTLNRFLKTHFEDVGAIEVKNVLDQIKDIRALAQAAEAEPAMSLERLQTEFRQAESTRETQRVQSISQVAERAWAEALSEITAGGEYPELTLKGDENHDKAVKNIVGEAAKEFGAYVVDAANNGLKKFDPMLAKIIAKRFALSEASAIIAASRAHHYGRAETTISESQRVSSMLRPPIGARAAGEILEPKSQTASTPQEAARALIQETVAKSKTARR